MNYSRLKGISLQFSIKSAMTELNMIFMNTVYSPHPGNTSGMAGIQSQMFFKIVEHNKDYLEMFCGKV